MPKANIDGIDIYYEVHGKGEPLVLLHHGTGSVKMWDELLSRFTAGYRVILYDRRGFGNSEKGENFRNYYTSEKYIPNSVRELSILLECLDIRDKVYILGQCEGGAIGFHYAAEYPDMVKAIAISSTMCCSKVTTPQPSPSKESKNPPSFQGAPPEFREKLIHWQGEDNAPEFFSLFVRGGGAYGTGGEAFDLRDTLKNVQCPALVLYPDRSRLFDVEQAVLMYHSLPNGELAVLPNCGHNTYSSQPDEYQRIILSFFTRHA